MRRDWAATAAILACLAVAFGSLTAAAQPPPPLVVEPSLVRYEDPVGDVASGGGPDIVAVTVSQPDPASVSITIEFAAVPPLAYDLEARWMDVLSIEIGTGPDGVTADPGGHPVADFWTGLHGVILERASEDGVMLASEDAFLEGAVDVTVDGPAVSLTLTRESLGDPDRIMFVVLAGREAEDDQAGSEDWFPDHPEIGPFTQAAWTFHDE